MHVIHGAETRRIETPNAVMTTLASPTQGNSSQSLWRVEMAAGHAGPLHGIDAEQVWTVLAGGANIEVGTDRANLGTGDTIVLPADVSRRITADKVEGLVAIVTASASMRAYVLTGSAAGPHPAATDADKVVPGWVV